MSTSVLQIANFHLTSALNPSVGLSGGSARAAAEWPENDDDGRMENTGISQFETIAPFTTETVVNNLVCVLDNLVFHDVVSPK